PASEEGPANDEGPASEEKPASEEEPAEYVPFSEEDLLADIRESELAKLRREAEAAARSETVRIVAGDRDGGGEEVR
ncbi:MAG: hypothetical protein IKX91_00320, partial [Firmicutes bacterium]|nr:hypothetical protein [Bacillota bacterium]